jgi:predicted dinucleotide-binding enzyme
MKIGIIGAGNIGSAAARLFVGAGHEVAISNSRGSDSLRSLVSDLGLGAHAMSVNDAARFGEVILLAVPWRSPEALPGQEFLKGKIVIDAQRHAIFVAGDDADAKRSVTRLIEEIGFAPVDTGSLRDGGRKQQPGSTIYNKPMTCQEAKSALTQLAQTYAG